MSFYVVEFIIFSLVAYPLYVFWIFPPTQVIKIISNTFLLPKDAKVMALLYAENMIVPVGYIHS
jgi:hypothetical protein